MCDSLFVSTSHVSIRSMVHPEFFGIESLLELCDSNSSQLLQLYTKLRNSHEILKNKHDLIGKAHEQHLRECESRAHGCSRQIEYLQSELDQRIKQLEELYPDLENGEDESHEMRETISRLQFDLMKGKSVVLDLRHRIESLSVEKELVLEEATSRTKQIEDGYKVKLNVLLGKIEEYEAKEANVESLEKSMHDLDQVNKTMQRRILNMEHQSIEDNKRNRELRDRIHKLELVNDEMTFDSRVDELKVSIKEKHIENQVLRKTVESLRAKLSSEAARISILEEEAIDRERRLNELRNDNEILRRKNTVFVEKFREQIYSLFPKKLTGELNPELIYIF